MEEGQLGWAQIFDPAATADEPTAAHPYYTLTFTDGDQSGKTSATTRPTSSSRPRGTCKTTETGFTASFTVVLTARRRADVTIPVRASDLTEGTVSTAHR